MNIKGKKLYLCDFKVDYLNEEIKRKKKRILTE